MLENLPIVTAQIPFSTNKNVVINDGFYTLPLLLICIYLLYISVLVCVCAHNFKLTLPQDKYLECDP